MSLRGSIRFKIMKIKQKEERAMHSTTHILIEISLISCDVGFNETRHCKPSTKLPTSLKDSFDFPWTGRGELCVRLCKCCASSCASDWVSSCSSFCLSSIKLCVIDVFMNLVVHPIMLPIIILVVY